MLCKEAEVVLEQEGFSPLPAKALDHVASCDSCQSLVADFEGIVRAAHELPAEVEPPARVWISVRAQLEAEGIIKSADHVVAERISWWTGWNDLLRGRALATATIGLLLLGVVYLQIPGEQPVTSAPSVTAAPRAFAATAAALSDQERDLGTVQLASFTKVDTSLKQNLDIVNQFIHDCEQRVNDEPQDELARDYLSGAYQQKADLLAAMMERGGSGK